MNTCEECPYKDWPIEKLQEQVKMLEQVIETQSYRVNLVQDRDDLKEKMAELSDLLFNSYNTRHQVQRHVAMQNYLHRIEEEIESWLK